MNNQQGVTADLNMRKAIAYAIDYDALPQDLQRQRRARRPARSRSRLKGHIDVPDMPRQDLDKAKEYLAKSEHANGGIKLEYVYVQGLEEERQMGLVLLDNLKELSIELEMVPLTWPNMVAARRRAPRPGRS